MLSAPPIPLIYDARMIRDGDDSREAISARLVRVREILGMKKKDFAAGAGMSEQHYGQIENMTRDLSIGAAKSLRNAYGLSFEFLFFGDADALPHKIAKEL